MKVLETERLNLRWLSSDDAPFMLGLVNEPTWIQYIGDRGIRTRADARDYILNGPVGMVERLGFGLYLVELKEDSSPMGICGLVKRDFLDDVDLGFAFLPRYWGQGYAYEAASVVLIYAAQVLGLKRIVAITAEDNHRSIRLLEKLGLHFERMVWYPNNRCEVRLFAIDFPPDTPLMKFDDQLW